MKFILGRKVGMTRVFDDDGRSFAVTKIAVLPCKVSQIKNNESDGYNSIQISAYKNSKSAKGETSPKSGKIIKIAEFKEENIKRYKIGEEIKASQFDKNEVVTVQGTAKGKGFAGTVKRHGFAMGPVSHGSKNVRKPGSIGGGYPQRVVKGKKMAGRMGGDSVTIKNLRIFDLDKDILLITGAIPGPNKSIVKIWGKGERAEEAIDHAAEEEKLAQEKMLEADAERKDAASTEGGAGAPASEGMRGAKDEKVVAQPGTDKEQNEPLKSQEQNSTS